MSYKDKPQIKLYKYENASFVLQAIIDDYQEISFSHNLYEAGDFTITINYNIPNALKFERGMFVQFGNDPYMFGEILTVTDAIGEDGKGSQVRTITGKDARYLFKRRVIKNLNNEENWAMTDKGEICLRELVKAQCGTGAESKRQLPVSNTIPSSSSALGKEYSVAEAFSNLYDTLVTIATQSEIGWRIKFEGTLTLEVFEGADLSSQVQFSTDYDSLSNGEFTDSAEAYANTVYVAGKGTGSDRDIYEGEQEIEGASPSGLDRFEAYDNQSSMTSESEYEAEALSMLTQYGQTINVSGQGLAKCPYIFKEQYNIGDTITLAFSGKSAKAQILSVTEHWVWGSYGIEFSFGKPQNDLSRQLQLILKQIQKASNKTTTTSSVKYYTIPTDTTMPKADVIYDTIGFQGTVNTGATFTLYYDSQKTGAKTYHVYFKQLGGTGKLTLTTGVSGKANLELNAGTYVAIIYVDQEGNVTSQGATPTTTISSGNTQPVTSGAVYDAIQQVTPATVDTAMSDTSTNAVQNKVIKAYVDTAEANAKNLSNATGTLAVAHGGTGQTSLDNVTVGASKNTSALCKAIDCNTAAGTAAKTVDLSGFTLVKGARLIVNLKNANTAQSALTLNVNSTGAKTIRWNGTVTSSSTYAMTATQYNCYYDGTYWCMDSSYEAKNARGAGTADLATQADYSRGNAYCTTAAGTQAKVANMRGYVLAVGSFPITFTNANSYNGKITLNVNSKGAKDVWINGTVSSSSNKTLPAGTYMCFYDGSKYMIDTVYSAPSSRGVNTVSADNMQSVTSGAVSKALFPDYSQLISIPSGTSWTATKNCYMQLFVISTSTTKVLTIDGNQVNIVDDTAGSQFFYSFNGYIKKGQVISWSDNLSNTRTIKFFACE